MEAPHWIAQHWVDLLQSAGIIGGLWFSAYSSRKEEKARKVGNLIALTQQYRDIWKSFYETPGLERVLREDADLKRKPITEEERLFVNTLILHLESVYRATKAGMLGKVAGTTTDIKRFFGRPIAREVWESSKLLRSPDFIGYIEASRR